MKLAFSLIVHKSPEQAVALVRAIAGSGNYCVIHCNARSGPGFRQDIERGISEAGLTNVRFIESEPLGWGSGRILRVELRAIEALLDWADDWTHHVNLSGQCLPTKPIGEIAEILAANEGLSFMELMDFDKEAPHLAYRYQRYHVELGGRLRNTRIPRSPPRDFKLWFGAFWCILSRKACLHVARSTEAQSILQYLRYTRFPDELAFQTILANSPLRDSLVPRSRRLMLWDGDAAHPVVLTGEHWSEIDADDLLFARKFDSEVDAEVIERLGRKIGCCLTTRSSQYA